MVFIALVSSQAAHLSFGRATGNSLDLALREATLTGTQLRWVQNGASLLRPICTASGLTSSQAAASYRFSIDSR
jgi:hypothetical protein